MDLDGIFVQLQMKFLEGFVGWLADDGGDTFMGEVVRDFGIVVGGLSCVAGP